MKPHVLSPAVRVALAIGLAGPFWLAACRQASESPGRTVPVNVATLASGRMEDADRSAPVDPQPPADAALTSKARKGVEGARAIIDTWARALEKGDWATALAQWGPAAKDADADALARRWQHYQKLAVTVGESTVEGAAGSLYYAVPVTIDGTLRDGRVQHLTGTVTMRRANDVDGASARDLAWHIQSSDLQPTP